MPEWDRIIHEAPLQSVRIASITSARLPSETKRIFSRFEKPLALNASEYVNIRNLMDGGLFALNDKAGRSKRSARYPGFNAARF
jgi:hypothetical protein